MARLSINGEILQQPTKHWLKQALAFRPFFLLAATFSIGALALWWFMLAGKVTVTVYGGPLWWHLHEMLFGFAVAVIAGFLLTAVQTWTQRPSLQSYPLLALVLLWLAARVLMLLPNAVPGLLIAIIDVTFLAVCGFFMGYITIKAKRFRNVIFMPILLVMAGLNALMHASVLLKKPSIFMPSALTMVFMVVLIMVIMAGRIFPMFTANGTKTQKIENLAWLEKSVIGLTLLVAISQSGWFDLGVVFDSVLLLLAAAFHAVRAYRWRIWVTFKTPLVWSLQISYWFIVAGFLLLALAEVTPWFSRSQAMHSFTLGAMGLMILSMMSRVSLGHTGRPLQAPKMMPWAFGLLILALVARLLAPAVTGFYQTGLLLATIAWGLAFLAFIAHYACILSQARPDGRPS